MGREIGAVGDVQRADELLRPEDRQDGRAVPPTVRSNWHSELWHAHMPRRAPGHPAHGLC